VAFSRNDILSVRPPTNVPIEGIELPEGSVVFPVGHHSAIRVALAHAGGAMASPTLLPDGLSSVEQVTRGWSSIIDRAGRLELPEESVMADIARLRTELALNGPAEPSDDAVAFLIDVGQLVRLGERADPWVPDIADAVAVVARLDHAWDVAAALDAAAVVLHRAGETRAVRDVARMRSSAAAALPTSFPADTDDSRMLGWLEQRVARAAGAGVAELMAGGMPKAWLGLNFEVHDLAVGPETTVSFAVRWHGDRPAVLWQTDGAPVRLIAPAVAPDWSSTEASGEALWPAPPGAETIIVPSAVVADPGADISFN
jgi:hypothetical protein